MIIISGNLNSKQISILNPATMKLCFQKGQTLFSGESPPPLHSYFSCLLFAICSELPTAPLLSLGYVEGRGSAWGPYDSWLWRTQTAPGDWASPKEMDAGLFQGLLVTSVVLR